MLKPHTSKNIFYAFFLSKRQDIFHVKKTRIFPGI
jgi:hypothetical protein